MNIYLIDRVSPYVWNEFEGFVIAASTEQEAYDIAKRVSENESWLVEGEYELTTIGGYTGAMNRSHVILSSFNRDKKP